MHKVENKDKFKRPKKHGSVTILFQKHNLK